MYDRCRHSGGAMTLVKYEGESQDVMGFFARSKISITEKFTKEGLVNNPALSGSGHMESINLPNPYDRQFWYYACLIKYLGKQLMGR